VDKFQKEKKNGEKMSPLSGSFGLVPIAGHTKTMDKLRMSPSGVVSSRSIIFFIQE
jgi:hypothetical protein